MANQNFKAITKEIASKGFCERSSTTRKITASTSCGTYTACLSPFAGLLGSIKFLDLLKFEEERHTCRVFCTDRRGKAHKGDGFQEDLGALKDLSNAMIASSMCGLGQTAAIPVPATLKFFRNDYQTRISHSVFLRSFQPIKVSKESGAQQSSFPMNRLKEVEK